MGNCIFARCIACLGRIRGLQFTDQQDTSFNKWTSLKSSLYQCRLTWVNFTQLSDQKTFVETHCPNCPIRMSIPYSAATEQNYTQTWLEWIKSVHSVQSFSCVCEIDFRAVWVLLMTTHYWMDFHQSVTIHEKCYSIHCDLLKWKLNTETRIEITQQCRGATKLLWVQYTC